MIDWANLATEQPNSATATIDELPTAEMLEVINGEDAKVASALKLQLANLAAAVDAVADALRSGGRLYYVGAGSSGRLGILDAAAAWVSWMRRSAPRLSAPSRIWFRD